MKQREKETQQGSVKMEKGKKTELRKTWAAHASLRTGEINVRMRPGVSLAFSGVCVKVR